MQRSRARKWKLVLALASVVAVSAAPSCGATDDVVRVLGHEMGKLDDVAREVPKGRLPGAVTTTREAVQAEIDAMMAVLREGDDDTLSAKRSAAAACLASDLSEVNSLDSAVDFAIQRTDTPAGRRASVKSLATELSQAESSGDQAKILAGAAICQWAG
jgi:hypothetical protein